MQFGAPITGLAMWAISMLSANAYASYAPPTGCPSGYGSSSWNTTGPPTEFNLIVNTTSVDQGYLYLSPGGRLREKLCDAATFTISDCQLKSVNMTDCGTCFVVGTEFCDESCTTLGLLPYELSGSITKSFSLVQSTPVTIGTKCLQYSLQWIDDSFSCGNGQALFAVDECCDGAEPCEGMEVTAQLTATPEDLEGQCFTGTTLYALPASK